MSSQSKQSLPNAKRTSDTKPPVQTDSWAALRTLTQARIGLGRAGVSIPTQAQLQFNVDHALARDAVNIPLNMQAIEQELASMQIETAMLHSRAQDRREYLQRPDLGRRLNNNSLEVLTQLAAKQSWKPDVVVVLVDGLSSTGVQTQGVTLCTQIRQVCLDAGFSCAPICLVEQGRVAIGDDVGEILGAKTVMLVVGERPGLSSPDSLGIYFTYGPKTGLNDASRNCISNIRPGGLSVAQAAQKALWLLQESVRLKLSGVKLKDTSGSDLSQGQLDGQAGNFLLADKS